MILNWNGGDLRCWKDAFSYYTDISLSGDKKFITSPITFEHDFILEIVFEMIIVIITKMRSEDYIPFKVFPRLQYI